jgi:hypothetical protein
LELLRKNARKYIKEKWWEDLCCSANDESFALFEKYLFDEEGVLDSGMSAFRKTKQSLVSHLGVAVPRVQFVVEKETQEAQQGGNADLLQAVTYLQIIDKFGKDTPPDWYSRWALDNNGDPYIDVVNIAAGQKFSLMEPKHGFVDHTSEVKAPRKRRDVGMNMYVPRKRMISTDALGSKIPTDKLKYYNPNV